MDWIVIMAGGGGTRLWPLSRRKRPKQFLPLLPQGETLLGATVRRVRPLCPIERTLVVTAASQVEEVRRAVPALPPENVVAEPEARNTAPAIGLSTVEVLRRDPAATIAVLPSDQFVRDDASFVSALQQAFRIAEKGHVVTIGIHPSAPETGFGYIEMGRAREAAPPGLQVRHVARFVEKPDRATAERYVASGHFVWNAGMFIFDAARMRREIARFMPELGALLDGIAADPTRAATLYPKAPKLSIDYGVMEKLPAHADLFVVEADFGWSDVGSFAALPDLLPRDGAGNVASGDTLVLDARDNVLIGAGETKKLVAAVGVEGLCVIVTDDAVLVLPRERAQDVRRVVETLEKSRREPYL